MAVTANVMRRSVARILIGLCVVVTGLSFFSADAQASHQTVTITVGDIHVQGSGPAYCDIDIYNPGTVVIHNGGKLKMRATFDIYAPGGADEAHAYFWGEYNPTGTMQHVYTLQNRVTGFLEITKTVWGDQDFQMGLYGVGYDWWGSISCEDLDYAHVVVDTYGGGP